MRRQSGFTIIEIIIVVIILGLLAATALPRFLDVTEQAEQASIDGIAGGFASAVGLVRGQWEVEGRPANNITAGRTAVTIDGVQIGINALSDDAPVLIVPGYPTGSAAGTGATPTTNFTTASITNQSCLDVLNLVLQNSPSAIAGTPAPTAAQLSQNALYVREGTGAFANVCFYIQTAGLTAVPAAAATSSDNDLAASNLNGFYYRPATGEVRVFKFKA